MNWKESYRAALVEVNASKLLLLIQQTESAMRARSESIPAAPLEELRAIIDATCTLRILKSQALAEGSLSPSAGLP